MSTRGNDWLLRQAQRTLNRLIHKEKGQKSGISSRNLAALQRSMDSFIQKVFDKLRCRVVNDDVYQRDLNRINALKKVGADEFTSSMLTEEHTFLKRYFKVNTHYKLDLLKRYFKGYYQLEIPNQKSSMEEWNRYTRQQQSNKSSLEGAHSSVLSMLEERISSCEKKYLSDLSARFCSLVTRRFNESAEKVRTCNRLNMPVEQFLRNFRSSGKGRPQKSNRHYEQSTLSNIKQDRFSQEESRSDNIPKKDRKKIEQPPLEGNFDPNQNNGQRTEFSKDDLDLSQSDNPQDGSEDFYASLADDLMAGEEESGPQETNQSKPLQQNSQKQPDNTANGGSEQEQSANSTKQPDQESPEDNKSSGDQSKPSGDLSSKDSTSNQSPPQSGSTPSGDVPADKSVDTPPSAEASEPELSNPDEDGVNDGEALPEDNNLTQDTDTGESSAGGQMDADAGNDLSSLSQGQDPQESADDDSSSDGSAGDDSSVPVLDLSQLMEPGFDPNTALAGENMPGQSVEKTNQVPSDAQSSGQYAMGEAADATGDDGAAADDLGFTSLEDMLRQMGLSSDEGEYDEDGSYDPNPQNFWTRQYWQTNSWKDSSVAGKATAEGDLSAEVAMGSTDEHKLSQEEELQKELDEYFSELADDLLQTKGTRFLGPGSSDGFLVEDEQSQFMHYFSVIENNSGIQKLLNDLGKNMALDNQQSSNMRYREPAPNTIKNPGNHGSMSGITMGNEINYVLPEELVKIADEDTEAFFDIKYLEKNLLRFDLEGIASVDYGGNERVKISPRRGRGPVVLCVDTSSSMQGIAESYAKATVMSLALKCHAAKRECFIINFSVHIEKMILREDDENVEEKLLTFLSKSFNGGSDLDEALLECLTLMRNDPRFYRSDVLCITDGQIKFSKQLSQLVKKRRQTEHNKFYELVIGSMANEAYWLEAKESIRHQSSIFDHLYELSKDGKWMQEVKL